VAQALSIRGISIALPRTDRVVDIEKSFAIRAQTVEEQVSQD
jgi:hypothetical protein